MIMSTYQSPLPSELPTRRTHSGFEQFSTTSAQWNQYNSTVNNGTTGRRSLQNSSLGRYYNGGQAVEFGGSSLAPPASGSLICESYKNVDFFSIEEPYQIVKNRYARREN